MNTPKIIAEVKKAEDGFALTVNGKAIQTPKGRPWICTSEQLARAAADDVQANGLKAALYKLQSHMIDTPADDVIQSIEDHFDTDLVFYEATDPVDLVAFQKQAWEPVRDWLCEALGGVPFRISQHTTLSEQLPKTHKALDAYVKELEPAQRTVAFFAGQLSASVAIGLAFAAKELDAEAAHKAGHADEYYQEERYKPDDLMTNRFKENIEQFQQLQNFRDFSY